MRAVVVLILVTLCGAAFADSNGERSSQAGDRTPNATEVISGLYAFGRFQQGLLESADLKGNQEVRSLATLRAEDAAKRDKALKQIQEAIGVEPNPLKTPTAALAGPDDSEGPAYGRQFYAVQVGEDEVTSDRLERVLLQACETAQSAVCTSATTDMPARTAPRT